MRPIELELSGLHSYRDAVRVDFEHLGEHGLFGIFGSIGSGKSTLLDGLTLALYGIVDRTNSSSRAGIVNHHSDRIEVRLRFSISPGVEPEVYEVHRVYRRTRKGSAERVNGRLARIDGEHAEVLADKEREINEAVARLLGLEAQDFMRAVVLPQGRFMRFLHLKGSERRAMLQRIFRLTAYGADLRMRIKARREKQQLELQGHLGELAGIGDASPKATRAARKEAKLAHARLAEATETYEAIDGAWEEARAVREHQARLASAETALAAHLAAQPEIDALRTQQERATQAEALRAPHDRLARATARVDTCQERVQAARIALRESNERLTLADQQLARTRADRVASAPALQKRQTRLEQAIEVEVDRERCAQTLRAQRALLATAEAHRAEARARLEALESQARELAEQRSELAEELAEAQVDAGDREGLAEVVRAHDRIRTIDRQRSAVDGRLNNALEALSQARAQLEQARAHQADATKRVTEIQTRADALPSVPDRESAEAMRRAIEGWAEAESELQRLERECSTVAKAQATAQALHEQARALFEQATSRGSAMAEELAVAVAALEARSHQHRASVLASELEPDTPCPVCGATEHPSPASPIELDELPVQLLTEGARRADQWVEAAGQRVAVRRAGASEAASRLEAAIRRFDAARARHDELQARAVRAVPRALPTSAAEAREALGRWLRAARDHEAQVAQDLAEARLAAERAARPVASASSTFDAAQIAVDAVQTEQQEVAREGAVAWEHFHEVRGAITLFDVDRLKAEMSRKDARAQKLVPEIRSLDLRAQQVGDDLSAARATAAATSVEHGQVAERVRQLERELVQINTRLGDLAPEGSPAETLRTTTDRLQGLEQAETQAAAARDAAAEEQGAAQRDSSEAEADQRSAWAEYSDGNQALRDVQAALGLDEECELDTLLANALSPGERDALSQRIRDWDQHRIALRDRVDQAERALGDDRIDARAWETLHGRRNAARLVVDEARTAAHASALHQQDLEARAERYGTLQLAVGALERKLARLKQLSDLVRGDRFVDYLANDYLRELVQEANRHLHRLTDHRYTLVLGNDGSFEIRDADGGGSVRPVHTLSGGETFVASLALALALSTQVQARSQHPLEFFFLDEGFGSLDAESLDRVMGALESLRQDSRTIGLISHLPSVRERVPRYLEVSEPGRDGAVGTTLHVRDN